MKHFKFISLLLLFLIGCKEQQPQSELYNKDLEHIAIAFANNVEALRLQFLSGKINSDDGLNYYSSDSTMTLYSFGDYLRYALYYNDQKEDDIVRTVETREWIKIDVPELYYSEDSLKCAALLIVNAPIRDKDTADTHNYNGYGIIGIRNTKEKNFKIYTMDMILLDYPTKRGLLQQLRLCYHENEIEYGINSPEFFVRSPDLRFIDSLDLYKVETELYSGHLYPSVFYSNQDSTINNNLCF